MVLSPHLIRGSRVGLPLHWCGLHVERSTHHIAHASHARDLATHSTTVTTTTATWRRAFCLRRRDWLHLLHPRLHHPRGSRRRARPHLSSSLRCRSTRRHCLHHRLLREAATSTWACAVSTLMPPWRHSPGRAALSRRHRHPHHASLVHPWIHSWAHARAGTHAASWHHAWSARLVSHADLIKLCLNHFLGLRYGWPRATYPACLSPTRIGVSKNSDEDIVACLLAQRIYCRSLGSYQTTNKWLRNRHFNRLHNAHDSRRRHGRWRLCNARRLHYPRWLGDTRRLWQPGQCHLWISAWWHCWWCGRAPSQWASFRKECLLDHWPGLVYVTNNGHKPGGVTGPEVNLHLAANLEPDALYGFSSPTYESLQLRGAHLNDLEVLWVHSWWTLGLGTL
mmetsp:Transcript_56771/g.133293  ORF Transcript_56771/g.133293 Transcript_56771/m.133293 type:complete len:394 (+) Transcript_56771:90-1271(+)